jgi:phosphoribosylformimino-5-aminoimidazole carboxamide ribotide isomerase
MIIIPAIDLLDGKVVRLKKGAENTAKIYSDDPLEFACRFQEAGAKWIHVVNLDGAFGRPGMNDAVIERLTRNLDIPVELGGGIRTLDRIDFWLDHGIGRVVLGSVAINAPEIVQKAIDKHGPNSIVAGIDIRDGKVAIAGWQEKTDVGFIELARKMEQMGICRVIVTDIDTDGMLTGPNVDTMIDIAGNTGLSVIASGGVGELDDIRKVALAADAGIEGVIVGKAIYENKLDVKTAIDMYQTESDIAC